MRHGVSTGDQPADPAVQQFMKAELIMNLNVAKALGLRCAAIALWPRARREQARRRGGVLSGLALLLVGVSLSAGQGQAPGKLPRVGILEPYAANDPGYRMAQALRDIGIEEGRDVLVEWRYAQGEIGRIPALAADLGRLKLDAIVAIGDVAIHAARREAATLPIIAGSDDLVGEGHVAGLSHPGGNVTGISILASELNAKRLERAFPASSRASSKLLGRPNSPSSNRPDSSWSST
jgi:putative ABC transport system substrate-binding protein